MAEIEPDQRLPTLKCCIQCSVPFSLDDVYDEKRMLFITFTLLAPCRAPKWMKNLLFSLISKVWNRHGAQIVPDQLLPTLKCSVSYSLDEAYNENIMLFITFFPPWLSTRMNEKSNFLSDSLFVCWPAPMVHIRPIEPYILGVWKDEEYNEKKIHI